MGLDGESSSGGSGLPHNLLSAQHLDTVIGSAFRGYVIRGDIDNLWNKLDASQLRKFLVGDGSDVISRILEVADLPTIPKSKIDTVGTWLTSELPTIPKSKIETTGAWLPSELPSTVVYNNQDNNLNGFALENLLIRLSNNQIVYARNFANTSWISLFKYGTTNILEFLVSTLNFSAGNLRGIGTIQSNNIGSTSSFINMANGDKIGWRNTINTLFLELGLSGDTLQFNSTNISLEGHTHVKANITDFAHTHTESDITNLVTDLASKEPSLPSKIGNALKFLQVNATENGFQYGSSGAGGTVTDTLGIPNLLEILANETVYAGISNSITSLDENEVRYLINHTCTLTELKTNCLTNGITANTVITVRKNGADTTSTVTFGSGVTGNQNDTTHTVGFVAGDIITIKIVGGASGTQIDNLLISLTFTKAVT